MLHLILLALNQTRISGVEHPCKSRWTCRRVISPTMIPASEALGCRNMQILFRGGRLIPFVEAKRGQLFVSIAVAFAKEGEDMVFALLSRLDDRKPSRDNCEAKLIQIVNEVARSVVRIWFRFYEIFPTIKEIVSLSSHAEY